MKKQILFNPDNSGRGICRTIKTSYHKISTANLIRGGCYGASGVLEIKDMKEAINTDANGNAKAIRACYGQCGYDSVFRGTGQRITGVMEAVEPKIAASRGRGEGWKQQLEINDSGTSNVITSALKDNYVMEPNVLRQERTDECKKQRKIQGDKGMKFNNGNKMYQPRTDGVSNTLSTSTKDNMLAVPELRMENGCLVDKGGKRYRIRKLTPRECFRLQDVKDDDIDKIQQAGIAKTNQYKLAGNSICISPMYHIFRKLFVDKENESEQLELF